MAPPSSPTSIDRVWTWYLLTAAVAGGAFGAGAPEGRAWLYVGIHVALLLALAAMRRASRRWAVERQRAARGAFTLLATPAVFLSLGLVLPAVHPEPWEWTWIGVDSALTGTDPTVVLQPWLTPARTEVLQWVYASFYFIPITAVAVLGWRRGGAAFDQALFTVAFCFLLSYLAYFLWPTLPPYRFLPHPPSADGLWLAAELRRALDAAELHRWDCFPSGHTMLSCASLMLAWRVRALFLILLPIVALLIASTLALRYHYLIDVLAGALLAAPSMFLARLARAQSTAPGPAATPARPLPPRPWSR